MNFLFFRDFYGFFLNFSSFKIDLFELNLLKKYFLSCADMDIGLMIGQALFFIYGL